jgi:uncharacterized protein
MPRSKLSFFLGLLAIFIGASAKGSLSSEQAKIFRSWVVTIVEDQMSRGPNPRWQHQDCAGLVRFAVRETLAKHDDEWRRANGFKGRVLPAELDLANAEKARLGRWKNSDETSSQFVRALPMIQQNAEFLGKTVERIEPGDLLFFDQGDQQHVMVWTGRRIVYHNGQHLRRGEKTTDNGLRAVSLQELMQWKDTRWRPRTDNPNFSGFYRLSFLNVSPNFEQGTP